MGSSVNHETNKGIPQSSDSEYVVLPQLVERVRTQWLHLPEELVTNYPQVNQWFERAIESRSLGWKSPHTAQQYAQGDSRMLSDVSWMLTLCGHHPDYVYPERILDLVAAMCGSRNHIQIVLSNLGQMRGYGELPPTVEKARFLVEQSYAQQEGQELSVGLVGLHSLLQALVKYMPEYFLRQG